MGSGADGQRRLTVRRECGGQRRRTVTADSDGGQRRRTATADSDGGQRRRTATADSDGGQRRRTATADSDGGTATDSSADWRQEGRKRRREPRWPCRNFILRPGYPRSGWAAK